MAIVTPEELSLFLQTSITSESNTAAAEQAANLASGAVNAYCGRHQSPWDVDTAPAPVKLVALRLAARLYENPTQRTAYSGPEGLSFSGSPVRILTDDEREALGEFRARHKRVGSFRMTAAAWSVPTTETAE